MNEHRNEFERAFAGSVLALLVLLASALLNGPIVGGAARQRAQPDQARVRSLRRHPEGAGEQSGADPLAGAETGLRFKLLVPTSFPAAIEGMATSSVDLAWLSPLAYVQAHQSIGAEPFLAGLRDGSATTTSQVVVRADSGIRTVEGLRGKRFAFVDQASSFGYLYPKALFKERGIDPGTFIPQPTFAGSDDKVILAVYNRQVDGGATIGEADLTALATRASDSSRDLPGRARRRARHRPHRSDPERRAVSSQRDAARRRRDGAPGAGAGRDDRGRALKGLHDLYDVDGLAVVSDADFEPVRRPRRAGPEPGAGDRRDPATPLTVRPPRPTWAGGPNEARHVAQIPVL